MAKRTVHFKIYRYDPDKDENPTCRTSRSSSSRPTRSCSTRWSACANQGRFDVLPSFPAAKGRVRFRRDEHQRQNGLACLTDVDSRAAADRAASAAWPAGHPRPDRGHDPVLQAVPLDQALPGDQRSSSRARASAVAGGPRGAQRPLRVHPVRVLLDVLPVVLVEPDKFVGPADLLRPTASSPTPATRTPVRASTTSRIRTACSAATPS